MVNGSHNSDKDSPIIGYTIKYKKLSLNKYIAKHQ